MAKGIGWPDRRWTRLGRIHRWAIRTLASKQIVSPGSVRNLLRFVWCIGSQSTRLSVPFNPPTSVYVSLEELAERRPKLAYQTYLANPQTTREIEANVRQ